jgi:hypothetical protein
MGELAKKFVEAQRVIPRYAPVAAAADGSRIVAARPTSVTPKITNGAFVFGSTPQYA